MALFYNTTHSIGIHDVDVWDLFGDQGFSYEGNSRIQNKNFFSAKIPTSVLNLYNKVIWIGNNYSGDLTYYNPAQVLEYVQSGKSFMLATRLANNFFSTDLKNYCGISSVSTDQTLTSLTALDSNLVNMPAVGVNSLVHLVLLSTSSEAIPIFDDNTSTSWIGGFRINKVDEGNFIFIAGRPYRFDNVASFANYDFIIDNWMNDPATGVDNEDFDIPQAFSLLQNYPNPFNPSTYISYNIPNSSLVTLKIYDILGKEIATLVNESKQAGSYNVQFDASNISSGVYFYSIQAGDFFESRKMILMK